MDLDIFHFVIGCEILKENHIADNIVIYNPCQIEIRQISKRFSPTIYMPIINKPSELGLIKYSHVFCSIAYANALLSVW